MAFYVIDFFPKKGVEEYERIVRPATLLVRIQPVLRENLYIEKRFR
jgi:hypothetical protein